MSEVRSAPDLRGLENQYEIHGELRGNGTARHYIGKTRDERAAEVTIVIAQKAEGGETSDLAHFAADSQILANAEHPAVPRVRESRWIGSDSVAAISDRVSGDSLGELLERGEKFPNARIARILEDVSAALDWAREAGVVHRGVTPDSLVFERGSNRIRVSFVPTRVPMTGVPDQATDARTIGMLAWAFLTGKPYSTTETRSIGEVSPNLAARVVEATDKIVRSKDHADAPDVETYLSVLAAGDVLKQAEVELLAQKEEYDEAHRVELQKCDIQRQEVEQHASEQASMLAGEREEFSRQMADVRAQLETERAQFESMMQERKERFAAVRAELDQQRAEMERRVAELEKYRTDVEKVRDEALAAREEAKTAREDAKVAANKAGEAAAAHAAAVRAANEAIAKAAQQAAAARAATPALGVATQDGMATPVAIPTAEEIEELVDIPTVDIPVVEPFLAPRLAKPPKAPKWDKIDPIDLEHTDEEAVVAGNGRPRWAIGAGVGVLALIIAAGVYGMSHRQADPVNSVRVGNNTVVPSASAPQPGFTPRGGFLTQSAGGAVTSAFAQTPGGTTPPSAAAMPGSPAAGATAPGATAPGATPAKATADSTVLTQAQQDSIAAAREARARRAAAREAAAREERRRLQALTDSLNSPSSTWNTRPDTVSHRDSNVVRVRRDTVARPDTVIRPRPDTLVRR
ncbi:MAG TPA: hypothetical protein VGM82_01640 [Gemmatimonadaceae bacterium]|jgi:hypothetical protein